MSDWSCDKCKSERMLNVSTKCSDRCSVNTEENENRGYVPYDLNIDGGDYLHFELCLDCGKLQGEFPLPKAEIEN